MKFDVTPELSTLLKTIRMQNNISAKNLASGLGKSPSYISKLEGGDVKTIREEHLTAILEYISEGSDFYEDILPNAVRVLYSFIEPARLVDQVWLMQYDVVSRQVTVPEGMADDILAHLKEKGITVGELAEVVNANIDSEMSASFLPNEIVSLDYEGQTRLLIRADFSKKELEQVLSKKNLTTSYFCVYCMAHSMFRMLHFPGVNKKLPPEDAALLLRLVAAYMEQWNLHSLVGFSHMLSSDEFIRRQAPLASAGTSAIDHIAEIFREASAHDAVLTAKQLNTFYDTLSWDTAFAMKLIGISFSELEGLSYHNKKKLLEEIQTLITRFDHMSEFEKKLENY